jgi:hypothetical protein
VPSAERESCGFATEPEVLLNLVTPPQDATFPAIAAELLSTTDTFNVGSSATHTATASVPSEESCTIASFTLVPGAERAETGPHEATPPEMVAELDFTVSFPLEAPSRHKAVALVPSPDMAILTPWAKIPTGDRYTGALNVGWAMATDEKP